MLIYKTKRGNFHQIQLTYVPDYDYLEKNHFDASANQINKIKADFSGYIEYSAVKDEKIIFVLHFEKGKLVNKIYVKSKKDVGNTPIGKPSLKNGKLTGIKENINTKGWETQCVDKLAQICVYVGDPAEEICGEWYKVGEECETVWVDDPVDPEDPPNDPCLDESGFYICDPENPDPSEPTIDCAGVSGGSAYMADCGCIGGTTGRVACPEDPCANAKALAANNKFKAEMNSLKSKTNLNREGGYTKVNTKTEAEYSEGPPDSLEWKSHLLDNLATGSLEYVSHSHFARAGSLSIFSGDDIATFSQLYILGWLQIVILLHFL